MLKGKKLLVLGASSNEISLVQRAQELGVYVIVTDYNIDYKLSPAKKFANEAWNISWSDLNSLEKLCKENNVNGVIAGYSEFRVENMILLCERLGLPCYLSMKQLEITRDKIKFKEECRKNNVPVVNEYNSIDEVNKYPVIVKPVDRAGSIGISIATNKIELIEAYEYAMEKSICKKVIIEDFIQEVKFDAYYSIVNGDITLLSTDDVIYAKNNGFEKVVQSGWVLPSKNHDNFIRKEDAHLKSMIKNMGIMNGYIFFSGFMNKSKDFVFFECGFRLCGGHLYNYFPEIGMYNNMDIFIYHSLLGNLCSLEKEKEIQRKTKMCNN